MDRSAHPPHAPAPASFAPPAPLDSSNLTTTVAQPSNPYTIPSQPATQAFAAPLHSAPACSLPVMSQTQPLSQALNDSACSAGIPVAQTGTSEPLQRSDVAPNKQSTADLYPHQIEGLGGPKATAPFLQDLNLVAEAAKRAQMGIVMRDLESVTL
ncbi:hypothetical protein N7492_006694 [Penicillium capsulatum]|uniref:Uncharacterized protein n=1 Tax=Penicillium capsulatum TaxID=69766 RepID=A0A9W9HYG1_9EURO|nr:hypothetical protein N7492_006694 [Penicillium capsulatum]KAJ6116530.1 hypothetical protein N7512_006255 [Penicillium capsulatum]